MGADLPHMTRGLVSRQIPPLRLPFAKGWELSRNAALFSLLHLGDGRGDASRGGRGTWEKASPN